MKNKLKKRLICHRLITALTLLFAPAEALQGHNETLRGSKKHNFFFFFFLMTMMAILHPLMALFPMLLHIHYSITTCKQLTQQLLLSPSTKVFVLNWKINFIDAPEQWCLEADEEKFYNKQHSGCRVKIGNNRQKKKDKQERKETSSLIYLWIVVLSTQPCCSFYLFVFFLEDLLWQNQTIILAQTFM